MGGNKCSDHVVSALAENVVFMCETGAKADVMALVRLGCLQVGNLDQGNLIYIYHCAAPVCSGRLSLCCLSLDRTLRLLRTHGMRLFWGKHLKRKRKH